MTMSRSWQVNDVNDRLAQPVQARVDAVEALRAQHHRGQPEAEMRVERVFRVVSLEELNQSK